MDDTDKKRIGVFLGLGAGLLARAKVKVLARYLNSKALKDLNTNASKVGNISSEEVGKIVDGYNVSRGTKILSADTNSLADGDYSRKLHANRGHKISDIFNLSEDRRSRLVDFATKTDSNDISKIRNNAVYVKPPTSKHKDAFELEDMVVYDPGLVNRAIISHELGHASLRNNKHMNTALSIARPILSSPEEVAASFLNPHIKNMTGNEKKMLRSASMSYISKDLNGIGSAAAGIGAGVGVSNLYVKRKNKGIEK